MKYQLLATDMDGTLLNSKSELTICVEKALTQWVQKGHYFTVSTGRPIQGVQLFGNRLPINAPVITYNGAMVVSSDGKDILFSQNVDEADAKEIIKIGLSWRTTMCIWSQNQLYCNQVNGNVEDYRRLSGLTPIVVKDYQALVEQGITKILFYETKEKVDLWRQTISQSVLPHTTFCPSKPYFLEFFNSSVSKAKALQKVCDYLQIDLKDSIAAGDGYNDLPMLECAGLGVAMSNAPMPIQEKCGWVAPSCDDDGVSAIVCKYI